MANQFDGTMPATPEELDRRRLEVMRRRRIGMDWGQIATEIGILFNRRISPSQVAEDYRVVMKARVKELHEEVDAVRAAQIFRLSTAILRIWERVDSETVSLDHVEMLIKLENRLSKLMGTDMPSQSVIEDKRSTAQLTEEQIKAKIAQIYERIQGRVAPGFRPVQLIEAEIVTSSEDTTHRGE